MCGGTLHKAVPVSSNTNTLHKSCSTAFTAACCTRTSAPSVKTMVRFVGSCRQRSWRAWMDGGSIVVVVVDDDAHDAVNLRMIWWGSACMVVLMFFLTVGGCFLFTWFLFCLIRFRLIHHESNPHLLRGLLCFE